MTITKVLTGHTSMDTAYLVNDYPYGFWLRCKIRYWLEYKAGFGFRFVSQTNDPRQAGWLKWNKPKAGTHMRGPVALVLDEKDYVHCYDLDVHANSDQIKAFEEQVGEDNLDANGKSRLQLVEDICRTRESRTTDQVVTGAGITVVA